MLLEFINDSRMKVYSELNTKLVVSDCYIYDPCDGCKYATGRFECLRNDLVNITQEEFTKKLFLAKANRKD